MSLEAPHVIELDAQKPGIAKTARSWHSLAAVIRRLRTRLPEAAARLVGGFRRISMAPTSHVTQGFDFGGHWTIIEYTPTPHALAPLTLSAASYPPPLYY